jgi:uncharacterized protein YacL
MEIPDGLSAHFSVIAAGDKASKSAQNIKFKHSKKHLPIFVDTSVLIDGRIVRLLNQASSTQVLLFIPHYWPVGEDCSFLWKITQTPEEAQRTRARHGLDIVKELPSYAKR